jgi:hypothetical protein
MNKVVFTFVVGKTDWFLIFPAVEQMNLRSATW